MNKGHQSVGGMKKAKFHLRWDYIHFFKQICLLTSIIFETLDLKKKGSLPFIFTETLIWQKQCNCHKLPYHYCELNTREIMVLSNNNHPPSPIFFPDYQRQNIKVGEHGESFHVNRYNRCTCSTFISLWNTRGRVISSIDESIHASFSVRDVSWRHNALDTFPRASGSLSERTFIIRKYINVISCVILSHHNNAMSHHSREIS